MKVDVCIVGSGFGGSVMACRLAEAGLRVCVLERGKAYPPGSFPRAPHEMNTNFWDPSAGLYGLFNLWSFPGAGALISSALGGGSHIYANVLIRKDEHWFEDADRPWPVTRADLDPHYDAVERRLNARFANAPPSIEVINAGVPGYTTYQELEFLKIYGLDMKPDLVILGFVFNDLFYKYLHRATSENLLDREPTTHLYRFNPEAFQGVLVKEKDLQNTHYTFVLEDGSEITAKGDEEVEYDGEMHSAANLFDALKEGYYGKF